MEIACFASLIAWDTAKPGAISCGGAYAPVVNLKASQYDVDPEA